MRGVIACVNFEDLMKTLDRSDVPGILWVRTEGIILRLRVGKRCSKWDVWRLGTFAFACLCR